MQKRLSFVIMRKPSLGRQAFENMIVEPALELDLVGRVQFEGGRRFTVTVEGHRHKVDDYRTYVVVGSVIFGESSHFAEYFPRTPIFGDCITVDYHIHGRGGNSPDSQGDFL